MARTLLAGDPVVYDGDPLRDLALPAFLDKFVRRKQKVRFLPCLAPRNFPCLFVIDPRSSSSSPLFGWSCISLKA